MSHLIAANLYIDLRSAVNFDLWVNKMSNSLLFNVYSEDTNIHYISKYVHKSTIVSRNMCLHDRNIWTERFAFHLVFEFRPSPILSMKHKKAKHTLRTEIPSKRKSQFELSTSTCTTYTINFGSPGMVFGLTLVPGFGFWFVLFLKLILETI